MVRALPADPDLDWLRKTAKQRLARARARDAGARLHLTQLELARDYGYTSWRGPERGRRRSQLRREGGRRRHHVRTSTDPAIAGLLIAAGAPSEELSVNQFEHAIPIFAVTDVPKALDYYVDKLGFRPAFTWEDPPTFASVARDDARIFLSSGHASGQPTGTWISIFLPDVDALHREYVESGALIVTPPADYPWGVREMRVQDPDGNVIRMSTGNEDE